MTAVCAAVSRGEIPIVFDGVRLAISEYHENDDEITKIIEEKNTSQCVQ